MPVLPLSEKQWDEGPARGCVALWNGALPGTGLTEKASALKPREKRCMAAWMFHTCIRVLEQYDDDMREDGVLLLLPRQKREKLRQSAEDFVDSACEGVPRTPAQYRLLEQLRSALHRSLHEV